VGSDWERYRWVCAPQYLSAGTCCWSVGRTLRSSIGQIYTSIEPMASVSVLVWFHRKVRSHSLHRCSHRRLLRLKLPCWQTVLSIPVGQVGCSLVRLRYLQWLPIRTQTRPSQTFQVDYRTRFVWTLLHLWCIFIHRTTRISKYLSRCTSEWRPMLGVTSTYQVVKDSRIR
jgi:hypothetical protein